MFHFDKGETVHIAEKLPNIEFTFITKIIKDEDIKSDNVKNIMGDWNANYLSDEEIKVLKKYKVWGKKKFMGREFMGIIRTTYLIDKKGKILNVWYNVKVKDHAKEVLKTLENIEKK